MIRAILQRGVILPLSPLPEHWVEGQELNVEEASAVATPAELEAWSREIDELSSGIPQEDFDRLESALAESGRAAKDWTRRRMGLP
ncbi:MAG TPA: hypothetical protein VHU81_15895 [Thermoanaerobaculia bacterium]|jgi:hypothetical protein|nr:hypothetical protein [Thermoanaerobaculia bacterium]